MRRRRRRRLLALLTLLAVIGAAIVWLEAGRIDPRDVPQSRWYVMATRFPGGVFAPLPREHVVVIHPVNQPLVLVAAAYLQQMRSGMRAERGGNFDGKTGVITILGEEPRVEAGMPSLLQSNFRHLLRHEYGHALLQDWLCATAGQATGRYYSAAVSVPGEPFRESWPDAIHPMLEDYLSAPRNVYGDAYFTSTFHEYFAESYARLLDGQTVPAATRRFLLSLTARR